MSEPTRLSGGRRLSGVEVRHDKDLPLVSVMTVVFDGAAYLRETIKSVVGQTYANIEYIIIDGGSRDGSLDIIKEHSHEIDYWLSEPDRGIYEAMNKAIRASSGALVGLVNAGDWLAPDAVERVVSVATDNAIDGGMISGGLTRVDSGGNPLFSVIRSPQDLERRLVYMPVNHGATFIYRTVFDDCGLYNEYLRVAGDWDFVLRAIDRGVAVRFLPEVICFMREGGISDTEFLKWSVVRERYDIRRRHSSRLTASILSARETLVFGVSSLLPKKLLCWLRERRWGVAMEAGRGSSA